MPDIPSPYDMRDWKEVAREYDRLVFAESTKDPSGLQLFKVNTRRLNFDIDSFFLPSYVGDRRQQPGSEEAINTMAAVLGASLVGIDKSDPDGPNWVRMQAQYYNTVAGLLLNNAQRSRYTGHTFWYEIYPAILFSCLVDRYPEISADPIPLADGGEMTMNDIMYETAERYFDASLVMGGSADSPGYNFTSFNLQTMKPVWNGRWREPDSAAGIAWVQYMAYQVFDEPRFLNGAEWALRYLDGIEFNPLYESLLPWGTYIAARINVELDRSFNVRKMVEWCFGPADARTGWGVVAGTWGGYDVHGLMGSLTDGGGYAFTMNTFDIAGALVPLVRYDSRYARAVGKWILNLANSARLFYPNYLPEANQSTPRWQDDGEGVVAYEGLRRVWEGISPFATGDSKRSGWGGTDFGLYGSSHVGILGGIVDSTEVPYILRLDLLATDFFGPPAYPSYLYFNPHPTEKRLSIDVPDRGDLYSPTEKRFIESGAETPYTLTLPASNAIVVITIPPGAEYTLERGHLLADEMVIDYQPLSVAVSVPRNGQLVYGVTPIEVRYARFGEVENVSFTVSIDEIPIFAGSPVDGLQYDTTGHENGSVRELTVEATGSSGCVSVDTVRFTVDNRPLSQNGARDFGNWKSYSSEPGRLTIDGFAAKLEPDGTSAGSIVSPPVELDFSREPVLVFDGFYPRGEWSISLLLEDGTGIDEIGGRRGPGEAAGGVAKINLGAAAGMLNRIGDKAVEPMKIILTTHGGNSSVSFFHENVEIVYAK